MSEVGREFADGQVVPGTRYRVVRLIGIGGMGSVYDVEHIELGKRFVLKSLLRELARRQDLVARLRQEWRALARLEHPNIVNVTDAGTSDSGVPFYVMERLEGETLGVRLARERRLPVEIAAEIAAGVLEGLSAAHAIGIVHRDVKPPNIFLLGAGGVKLLDFGIAKIASSSPEVITARGLAIGTPRYMSPQQVRGERVDGRTDLYAVGLLLFEMIAGAGPFDDVSDPGDLLLAHVSRPAPPLSSLAPGVAPEIERIVAALLEKDPRQRPSSARVVARALKQAVGRTSQAPPDPGDSESLARASDPPTELPPTRRELVKRAPSPPASTTLGAAPTLRLDALPVSARPTLRLDAPTLSDPGPTTELDPASASARLERAAEGVTREKPITETIRSQRALGAADTLFDLKTPSAGTPNSDRTLTLAELGEPSRSVAEPAPTHTAVPVAGQGGETPPPVESGAPPAPAGMPRPVARKVALGGAAFAIAAALVVAWALHGGVSGEEAAKSDVAASARPEPGPTAAPAASTPSPTLTLRPDPAASAAPRSAASPGASQIAIAPGSASAPAKPATGVAKKPTHGASRAAFAASAAHTAHTDRGARRSHRVSLPSSGL